MSAFACYPRTSKGFGQTVPAGEGRALVAAWPCHLTRDEPENAWPFLLKHLERLSPLRVQRHGDVSVYCVMSKEDEYRQHAAEAFELAKRTTDKADRAVMLAVAKGWLDLAQRCLHRPEPPTLEHPLVHEKFRNLP